MDPTQSHAQHNQQPQTPPTQQFHQQPPTQNPFRIIQGDTLEHYRENQVEQSLWRKKIVADEHYFHVATEEETESYLGLQWLRQKYPYRPQSVIYVSASKAQLSNSIQANQRLRIQNSDANLEGIRLQNKLREQAHELEGKAKSAEERRLDTEKQLHNLIESLKTHHTETMNSLRKEMQQRFEGQISIMKAKLEAKEEALKHEIDARTSFEELFTKIERLKTEATVLQDQKRKVRDIATKMNETKVECDLRAQCERSRTQTEEKSKVIHALEEKLRKTAEGKDREIKLYIEKTDKKETVIKQLENTRLKLQSEHETIMAQKDSLLRELEAKRIEEKIQFFNSKEKIEKLEKEVDIQFKRHIEDTNNLLQKAETSYDEALKKQQLQMSKKAESAAVNYNNELKKLEQRLKQSNDLLKKAEGEGRSKQQYISMQSKQIERLNQERDTVAKEKQSKEKLLSEIEGMFPKNKQGPVQILDRINAQLKLSKGQISNLNNEKAKMSALNNTISEEQHSNLKLITSVRDSLKMNFSSLSAVCRDNEPGPNLKTEADGKVIKVVFYEVLTICGRRFNQSTQQISQLRLELSRQKTQQQKLDSEMKNLRSTIVGLEQQKRDLDQLLRDETLRLRKQTQQLDKCRTQLSISEEKNGKSISTITFLNQAIANLKDQLRKAEQNIKNIQDKLKKAEAALSEEKRRNQSVNQELSAKITTLDDQLEASKNDLVRAKQQLAYKTADLEEAEKQIEQLKDEKTKLEQQNKQSESDISKSNEKFKNKEEELLGGLSKLLSEVSYSPVKLEQMNDLFLFVRENWDTSLILTVSPILSSKKSHRKFITESIQRCVDRRIKESKLVFLFDNKNCNFVSYMPNNTRNYSFLMVVKTKGDHVFAIFSEGLDETAPKFKTLMISAENRQFFIRREQAGDLLGSWLKDGFVLLGNSEVKIKLIDCSLITLLPRTTGKRHFDFTKEGLTGKDEETVKVEEFELHQITFGAY